MDFIAHNGRKYNNNVIECEHTSVNERIMRMRHAEDVDFVEAVLHLKDTYQIILRAEETGKARLYLILRRRMDSSIAI